MERLTVPPLRSREAVGVIEALERRLPARAERALIDGVLGVALELDHPPFAVPGEDPAAGRALAADGGEPGGDPGNELLVRNHEGQERLGGLAAAPHRRAGPRGRHDLEEVASVHI